MAAFHPPSVPDWSASADAQRDLAVALGRRHDGDLELGPVLLGYHGSHAIALVGLRAFERGKAVDAVVEALAFMVPFGADRLSLGLPARAWSTDDPIAPVTADADLRQRVLLELRATATQTDPKADSRLHPYEVSDGEVRWGATVQTGPGEGALGDLLPATFSIGCDYHDPLEILGQMARLDGLGHVVALTERGTQRLLRLTAELDDLVER